MGDTFEGKHHTAYCFFRSCLVSYQYSFGLNGYMFPKSVERTAVLHFTAGFFSASLMVPFPLRRFGPLVLFVCWVPLRHWERRGSLFLPLAGTASTSAFPGRKEQWLPPNPRPGCPFVVVLLAALVRVTARHTVRGNRRVDSGCLLCLFLSRGGTAFPGSSGPRWWMPAGVVGDFVLVEPYGGYASTTTSTTGSLR